MKCSTGTQAQSVDLKELNIIFLSKEGPRNFANQGPDSLCVAPDSRQRHLVDVGCSESSIFTSQVS